MVSLVVGCFMKYLGPVMCVVNVGIAVVSFMPCLMIAAMSMDSPQAQNNPMAVFVMWVIFTFPVVCAVCGLLSLLSLWRGFLGLIGFVPFVEAGVFFLLILSGFIR